MRPFTNIDVTLTYYEDTNIHLHRYSVFIYPVGLHTNTCSHLLRVLLTNTCSHSHSVLHTNTCSLTQCADLYMSKLCSLNINAK